MARSTTSELIMSLIDRVSGPARKVGSAVRGLNGVVRDSSGVQVSTADRIAAAQMRTQGSLDRARLGMLETVGTYYLLKDAVTAPIRAAAAFETQLEDIGQKAGIPTEKLSALGEQIKQVARDTNQATSSIASAIDAMVGRGAGQDVALAAAAPIGKAATAYRASTEDLSAAAWAAVDNLKVPADQIGTVMDMMATAGKEGAFELRDMAQYFPALGAAYQALGQDGVGAVADLSAALQVVRKGTGDSAGAATNLANVLQKMRSPATVRAFKKMGVSLEEPLEEAAERGLSPIEAIAEVTEKALGGDLKKLGYLFEDAQAQAGIRSLIQGMDEYERIRKKAVNSEGVVDADFERRTRTAAGAMERWNASVQNLNIALGTTLLPLLNDLLDGLIPVIDSVGKFAAAYPDVTKNVMAAFGALLAFKGAVSVMSFVGLTGKAGALAMLANGFRLVAGEAAAANRAIALGALGKLALRATPVAAALYAGLAPKPLNMGPRGQTEDVGVQKANDALNSMTEAERTALHDAEAARAAAGLTQKTQLVSTQNRIATLKDDAAGLVAYIAELQSQIDNLGSGPAVDAMVAPLIEQLGEEKAKLEAVTSELVTVQDQAAKTGAAVGGLEGIDAKIKINMVDLDAALMKITQINRGLGGAVTLGGGGPAIDGRRAKGGPVSRGKTYLVGENGPEVMTASKSGYIHPTGQGGKAAGASNAGGGVHIAGINVTVTPNMTFPNAKAADAEEIARTVIARIKDEIGFAMRGVMADVSMA